MIEAVFPGSFDPLTNGHVDIVQRAVKMFPIVTVAVLSNSSKEGFFPVPERMNLIREVFKDLGDRVRVDSFQGLLVDFLATRKSRVIIRGLRAISDYDYEVQMALMNKSLSEEVETVFLVAREENSFISSSIVKQVAFLRGDISKFVPASVARAVRARVVPQT